jgi:pyruvate dehydrogenase phosphatase
MIPSLPLSHLSLFLVPSPCLYPPSPDATFRSEIGFPTLSPALAGACALLTYVDCANDDMYVALAGDCRAVAGIWDSIANKWKVEVLTEDQTGRNPKELARFALALIDPL